MSAPSVRKYVLVSVGLQEVDMVMGGTLSNCTLLNSTHHAFQPNSPSFYWSLPSLLMLLLLLWHIPFFHMTRPIRHPYTVYITFSLLRQNLLQISIFTILNSFGSSTIQESRFNICLWRLRNWSSIMARQSKKAPFYISHALIIINVYNLSWL